ncbi:MAG: hypothetical protein ACHQPI_03515 [Thermoanaerobaculia bacterium]
MERASSESSLAPFVREGVVASPEIATESSARTRLLLLLALQAAAFALASASGKIPEFAVVLFRALLTF